MTHIEESYPETASEIIKALASFRKPMRASELKEKLNRDWNTISRNLVKLERAGRVHAQYIGGQLYYVLNGKGKFQDKIKMSDTDYLWLDIFEPNLEEKTQFIRVKQTRKRGIDFWEPVGSVSIKKEQIDEFIKKLVNLKATLRNEYSLRNEMGHGST